jgi:hypothetical protein
MKKSAITLLTLLLLLSTGFSTEQKSSSPQVTIDNFSFTPATLTIRRHRGSMD